MKRYYAEGALREPGIFIGKVTGKVIFLAFSLFTIFRPFFNGYKNDKNVNKNVLPIFVFVLFSVVLLVGMFGSKSWGAWCTAKDLNPAIHVASRVASSETFY